MIWGLSTSTFTIVHVVLSLVGIFTGLVAMFGLVAGRRLDGWTVIFLATTVATSVTGFGFPFDHLLPSHKVGIVSLLVLPVAIAARYAFHLAGGWRRVYVIAAAVALYLNIFVLVVQAFLKVPALKAIAPTQKEPPFAVAQVVVLALFGILAVLATKRFPRGAGTRGFIVSRGSVLGRDGNPTTSSTSGSADATTSAARDCRRPASTARLSGGRDSQRMVGPDVAGPRTRRGPRPPLRPFGS